MNLLARIVRLFTADLHAVLDTMEDPQTLLRQSLREMQSIIEREDAQRTRLVHRQHVLERRQARLRNDLKVIERQLDFAFAEQNEPLARVAIRKRLETERTLEALSEQRDAVDDHRIELSRQIDAHRTQLDEIQERLAWCESERQQRPSDAPDPCEAPSTITEQEVDFALLQEQRRRRQTATVNPSERESRS